MADDKLRDYLRKVTLDLRKTRRQLQDVEQRAREPIAIVSMACRYPGGVRSPEELWELSASGGEVITGFPDNRGWDLEALYHPDPDHPRTSYVREGGFIHDADEFDAAFFGISPREALAMDPQQRLLLEVSWEAFERAGLEPKSLSGSQTGVFTGLIYHDYGDGMSASGSVPIDLEAFLGIGSAGSIASGRVAYAFGLEGPAVTVDTACSSSLVAMHLACAALRARECGLALAGGVTLLATPQTFIGFSRQRGLAPDARVKSYADAADGTIWSEGVGVLLLERLSDAERLGHPVLGLVRGSAVNQDGTSNGLTAPNGPSQRRVIEQALASAGLSSGEVDVVEGHGTGTRLGDPIEAQALLATYGQGRPRERPLWLGSIKSNLGHTQAAAGVAGVIKMVMAMRHGVLPRTLHVDSPTSQVDWSRGAVSLLTDEQPWPSGAARRRAGVSSFGISGTNAHVIVEEPPEAAQASQGIAESRAKGLQITPWLLSARDGRALPGQAERLRAHLNAESALSSTDVGLSLASRAEFEHRAVVLGDNRKALLGGLSVVCEGASSRLVINGVAGAPPGGLAFLFTGQGAQRPGMGKELLGGFPEFKEAFEEVLSHLDRLLERSLSEIMFAEEGSPDALLLNDTSFTQPALFALEVALFRLLQSFGVRPDFLIGHSIGELTAAHVAGVLSLGDAARLVVARGRLMGSLPAGGAMVALQAGEQEVRDSLRGIEHEVAIAAVNGPSAVVISGEGPAVEGLAASWERQGRKVKRLTVSHAFHSPRMEPMLKELAELASGLSFNEPSIPIVSNLTGEPVTAERICDPAYWAEQARSTVRFADGVRWLHEHGVRRFLELGPDGVLAAACHECLAEDDRFGSFEKKPVQGGAAEGGVHDAAGARAAVVVSTLRRQRSEPESLLAALAELWVDGGTVDWQALFGRSDARHVALPTYAFQRERYWLAGGEGDAQSGPDGIAGGERRFWEAVEAEDVGGVAGALRLVEDRERSSLEEVLPALSDWRRRRVEESLTDGWRYRVEWKRVGEPQAGPSGSWIVLVPACLSEDEWVASVLDLLSSSGTRVERLDVDMDQACDPAVLGGLLSDALSRLSLEREVSSEEPFQAAAGKLAGVLSLLALSEDPNSLCKTVPAGLAGTLVLAQALEEIGAQAPVWLATRGAVSVAPGEQLDNPAQAMVWGLGLVVGLERPQRRVALVDLPPALDDRALRALRAMLAGTEEDQLAVRSGGVFARRLVRAPVSDSQESAWRCSGTALITGGTGFLGAHIARWLTRAGARNLILASRRGPEADGATELKSELEGLGADVQLVACDVGDREQLAELFASLPSEHPLDVVVHAAGLAAEPEPFDALSIERLQQTLNPKAQAALHLHELTQHMDLSAFVLCSSLAATMGSGGQADYAAANAFLDALAEHRRARDLPATSLAWGLWEGKGMGGAAADELHRRGVRSMPPEQAVGVLAQTIERGESALTVADIDWDCYAPLYAFARARPLIEGLPEAAAALSEARAQLEQPVADGSLARRLSGMPERERERAALELVRGEAASVLGHAASGRVDPDRAFRELGFDSLTAVELRSRLQAATGVRLAPTVVFDYPTSALLARHLVGEVTGGSSSGVSRRAATPAQEPVAIVAMSCRFPGDVGSPEELWSMVRSGTDAISSFPTDRGWDLERLYDPDPDRPGTSYTREGGFVGDVGGFDASFFGINPKEALAMDPQQRILLELCWEAIERAGIDPQSLRGTETGVFVGINPSGYANRLPGELEGYQATAGVGSVISGRVAYTFGLEGPAVSIDTACSSSLVALHLACAALRAGECDMTLAGGVAVMSTPDAFVTFSRQRGLAPDGRCKSFADTADGTGWSEGAGMLVLERQSDARRLGHPILALVRGSAINQDGASNGLTAPSGLAQQRVIRQALANAHLSADQVQAVEGHGTGTKLGDPIEVQSLLATYGQERRGQEPLWLGSIKSNIGHPQAAAGIAGVIKMVMALRRQTLPRTLHAEQPSSQVDWSRGEVSLLCEERPWEPTNDARRAGVSSFGASGTNAHVILEEAPTVKEPPSTAARADGLPLPAGGSSSLQLVPWLISAGSEQGLEGQARRLRAHLSGDPDARTVDIGLSLASRAQLEHRAVILGGGPEALLSGLDSLVARDTAANLLKGVTGSRRETTAFMFTGQGAQYGGMGAGLYEAFPGFREALDEVCGLLDVELGCALRDLLFAVDGSPLFGQLEDTKFTQAGLFALEVALSRLLESWGVRPDYVMGHSIGEVVAAHVAGVLGLEDACRLVAARGRLMSELPRGGAMVAVQASEEEAIDSLAGFEDRVVLAAVNGSTSVVLSGEEAEVSSLARAWEERGRMTKRLAVSHAFHSPRMDGMLEGLVEVAAGLSFGEPQIPIVSNVTGRPLTRERVSDPGYWAEQARSTVRFADGVRWLGKEGVSRFVELGPGGVLAAVCHECLLDSAHLSAPASPGDGPDDQPDPSGDLADQADALERAGARAHVIVPVLRRERSEPESLLGALGEVWADGGTVDWRAVFECSGGRPVALPTYAFQRERYWLESDGGLSGDASSLGLMPAGHPLLGAAVALADDGGWLYTGRLSLRTHPWLADHVVLGQVLLPGTAFLELALYACGELGGAVVRELTLQSPLLLGEHETVHLQVMVGQPDGSDVRSVSIHSRVEGASGDEPAAETEWVCHAAGSFGPREEEDQVGFALQRDGEWPVAGAEPVPVSDFYDRMADGGLDYGPIFRGLQRAWQLDGEFFAEVALPEGESARAGLFALHPALLDAALHTMALVPAAADSPDRDGLVRLPFSWQGVALMAGGASSLRARIASCGKDAVSIFLSDQHGRPVAAVRSLAVRSASRADLGGATGGRDALFSVEWKTVPVDRARLPRGSRWALIAVEGDQLVARSELDADGLGLVCYPDFSSLGEAIRGEPGEIPDVVVIDCRMVTRELPGDARLGVGRLLGAVQEWLAEEQLGDVRIVVLTRGAVAVHAGEDLRELASAAVWGFVRSAQSENPGRLVLVDVDEEWASWETLAQAVATEEPQIAMRGGDLLIPRLKRAGSDLVLSVPAGVSQWRLQAASAANTFEGLALAACPDAGLPLEPGDVRVGVRAGGANFRDALIALGMYPGEAMMGSEAAGIVLEVGSGVEDLAPGDRVMGLFPGAFGPLAITDSRLVAKMPERWTFAQAASMPLAFLTAYYGLVDLAGLQRGERLLVHSAAGGVGMAAVQLARHLGAEVFGTASPAKWPLLEARGFDAAHIASSREPGFEERFLEVSAGQGMDVVLNSLTREFIDASLRLLPSGGRFLEMGKTDLRDPSEVATEHAGALYKAFDLMDAGPERIKEMLASLIDMFERGLLTLSPIRAWDIRRAPEALRFMSRGRHVGKIVFTLPTPGLGTNGTVLITGGTGALAGLLARHLVTSHGVGSLLLASRAGEAAPEAAQLRDELESLGASVRIVSCNVSDREQLKTLISSIDESHPLRGVVHAAGVLDDGVIGSLTPARLERVLAPKVDGAWHLHELTAQMDLDLFVLFSSAAATLGSPGQASYASANAFLDAVAMHRRALGLPAIAMAWGPWEQTAGMTSGLSGAELNKITSSGMLTLSPEQGLELFDAAVAREEALLIVMRLARSSLRARAAAGTLPSLLTDLAGPGVRRSTDASAGSLVTLLAGAAEHQREHLALRAVCNQVAMALGHASSDAIEPSSTFKKLGFDSLTAVELRNGLSLVSGQRLPATLIFDYPTPVALTRALLAGMTLGEKAPDRSLELQLEKLEQMLSTSTVDGSRREQAVALLETLLRRLNAANGATESVLSSGETLQTASAEEIYDFIDRQLGSA